MTSKARLQKIEQTARSIMHINLPRTFIYFEGAKEGTIDGVMTTLENWLKIHKANDTEILIRFVDEKPISTLTTGRYTASIGADLSKL